MGREPWLSVNLSLFLPGLGQALSGRRGAGIAFFALYLALAGVALVSVLLPDVGIWVLYACAFGALGVGIASLVHAHRTEAAANPPEFEAERKAAPDGLLAVFLTRFLPGLGHAYLKRYFLAAALILVSIVLGAVLGKRGVTEAVQGIWAGFVSYHAYRVAPVHRAAGDRWIKRLVAGVVLSGVLYSGVVSGLRGFVVQAFRTPADSMAPTLRAGDYFFVRKWDRGRIRRGDVVVFPFPSDRSKDLVKRVIGMPGDRVEIRNKIVWLNGHELDDPHAIHLDSEIGDDQIPRDNFGPVVVPQGQLFVLGDNRDHSNDSRYWGPLPVRDVKGIGHKIYWPLSRAGPIH